MRIAKKQWEVEDSITEWGRKGALGENMDTGESDADWRGLAMGIKYCQQKGRSWVIVQIL